MKYLLIGALAIAALSGAIEDTGRTPLQDSAASSNTYQATPGMRDRMERFLALSGGRDVWKDVQAVRVLAVNRTESVRLPYLFEVTVNFAKPQTMTRLLNQDMDRLRAYVGDSGWGVKESGEGYEHYDFGPERLPFERILWEGAFSRNVWRLAINDPELVVREGNDGRVEFHNREGGLTAWFILNEDDYPVRFGFPGDDTGLSLGAPQAYGPRVIPFSGETPDGVYFESLYLRVSETPYEIPRSAPADLSRYNPR